MKRKPKGPYQRIMIAASKGVGVRLSALEVAAMSIDNAIETAADRDDEEDQRVRDEIGPQRKTKGRT